MDLEKVRNWNITNGLPSILRSKLVQPAIVVLGLAYISWSFSYYVCWREARNHHSQATGVGLIVGNIALIVLIYYIWYLIWAVGPGIQPQVPVYKLIEVDGGDSGPVTRPPDQFLCDVNGYPTWCSNCSSIKLDRAHHSSHLGHCVPRLDHYCGWIGCVIGRDNQRLFLQYSCWFLLYFVFIGVCTAVYARDMWLRRGGSLNPNVIVLLILCIGWIAMLAGVVGLHVYYICRNITTLETMTAKHRRMSRELDEMFMNVLYNKHRFVVRIFNDERYEIWDHGKWANWCLVMSPNPANWLLPLRLGGASSGGGANSSNNGTAEQNVQLYSEKPSKKFMEKLFRRIENGECKETTFTGV